jgi:uncharacterized membrane protein
MTQSIYIEYIRIHSMNMIKTFAIFGLMMTHLVAHESHTELLSKIKQSDYKSFKKGFAQEYEIANDTLAAPAPIYIDTTRMPKVVELQEQAVVTKIEVQNQQLDTNAKLQLEAESIVAIYNNSLRLVKIGAVVATGGMVISVATGEMSGISWIPSGVGAILMGVFGIAYLKTYRAGKVLNLVNHLLSCHNAVKIDELLKRCVAKQSDN